ncbi:TetR family transcriptional regulator [Brevibacterium litoralis]|uniref:TetR family transcriptional regulator n=1 Tax=Brevibacterium litoralis TaxID=3138935 RepID=UPI0032EC55DA
MPPATRAPLDVAVITDAAVRILGEFGLGDLSMRRLARELDVRPSALYWHVASKQELLGLVGDRLIAEVDARCPAVAGTHGHNPAAAGTDPRVVCLALRDVLLGHRDGAEILLLARALHGSRVRPAALGHLPEDVAANLMSFVLGHVQIEQTRAALGAESGVEGDAAGDVPGDFLAGITALLGHD